ncbi:amino acid ABC transporter substrate-binding protein [Clostridium sp. YIM B02515]|uniref:Amino acid ABC transporter substrate-binding protein n=1 Tax=Clostridium rhizosphaerae TaxID=2803861 RepID=A0ABS1TBK2_9CLOT|nr:ABC transporter substrate-binding protein [Clostridium rhizosphaerae]MBL4936477.1 amino acid ABC transporter substrate-binding protein [Clostridium rhizosphaerae]
MKKIYMVLLAALIIFSTALFYINLKTPIKIALIGNLEEEKYNFSTSSIIAGRIAEKEINEKQGIKGRKTQLIIRSDDFKKPEETIKFLKENNIEAIISTSSSEEILRIKPYLDKNKIICFSLGATSSELSFKDDYIYSMLPNDEEEVKTFVDHLSTNNLPKDIVIISTSSNVEYKNSIEKNIKKVGGNVAFEELWTDNSIKYTPTNIEGMKGKTILILSSARDTAIILQKLNNYGLVKNAFGLSWSGDENLIFYGGKPVQDFKFITPVDFAQSSSKYGKLADKLKDYEKSNGLLPAGVYEAYNIFKNAYGYKRDKHITLKEAIDITKSYDGLNSDILLNKYGDYEGKEYIFTVKDGKFTKLGGTKDEGSKN